MTTLLQINASIFGADGVSSQLSDQFVAGWQAANPADRVITRDLARDTPPHLTAERFTGFSTASDQRTTAQQEAVAYSDALIAELGAAQLLVLGLPMYNFGLPTQFKAWFDHVARAGVTFNYTAQGLRGAFPQLRAVVFASRGGTYAGTANDLEVAHLKQLLGLIGITDVHVVFAEGMARAGRDTRMATAREEVAAAVEAASLARDVA